jgi:uncharacterized RDD family membrane protein YckC
MLGEINIPKEEINAQPNEISLSKPIPTIPPIAGFWRRLIAWVIDYLILLIIGTIIGQIFSSLLYKIGPFGRPLGILIIYPYFGLLGSKIGGGQTIGKRLTKIAIRNNKNEPIGVNLSFLRIFLLSFPAFFNSSFLMSEESNFFVFLQYLLFFGLGGAILFSIVLNRSTRQGIHDLIVNTYVVELKKEPVTTLPSTSQKLILASFSWIGLVGILSILNFIFFPAPINHESFNTLESNLTKDPRVLTIKATRNPVYYLDKSKNNNLIVEIWTKGNLTEKDREDLIFSSATTTFESIRNMNDFDNLVIKITSGYDIWVSRYIWSFPLSNSIQGWRELIS